MKYTFYDMAKILENTRYEVQKIPDTEPETWDYYANLLVWNNSERNTGLNSITQISWLDANFFCTEVLEHNSSIDDIIKVID